MSSFHDRWRFRGRRSRRAHSETKSSTIVICRSSILSHSADDGGSKKAWAMRARSSKNILGWGRERLDRREGCVVDCYLREHILHRSCCVVFGLQLPLECPSFLFEYAIDILFDLLVFIVDRLTFCPVNELEILTNLLVEVFLALAQLFDARVLPELLQLLKGGPTRSTRIDHTTHPVRSNDQVPSRRSASISRLRIVTNHAGKIIPLKNH